MTLTLPTAAPVRRLVSADNARHSVRADLLASLDRVQTAAAIRATVERAGWQS